MIIQQFLLVGRFENLVVALNVTDDRKKKALLFKYTGEEAGEPLLDGHFAPESNISYERYLF